MRLHLVSGTCAMFLLPLPALTQQNPPDDSVVHGTVNIALGNENGIVVLTDSMVTAGGRQLSEPGQKLFKLDDRTVCSIAGFAAAAAVSGPVALPQAAVPDLDTSASAIIHEYVRQSALQPHQTMMERLRTLAFLMNIHLSAIANVRDALGNPTPINGYRFQLIVAGYDTDDKPKIGKITLRMKNDRNSFTSEIEEGSLSNIEDKLISQLNGMPDIASQLLQHPESKPRDAALVQYATSLRQSGGRSLSIEQMVALAKRLAYYTSQVHSEVGGPNQIAILQKQHSMTIEQPRFPEPARPLVNFSLMVDSQFSGNAFSLAKGMAIVSVRCS